MARPPAAVIKDGTLSKLFTTKALVLGRRPLGESDEIVAFLSADEGRFDAVARGSKRSKSSLVAKIEPFNLLQAQFARGRGELSYLNQATAVESFARLRADLDAMMLGSYLVNLWKDSLESGQPTPEAYEVLLKLLRELQDGHPVEVLGRWAEDRLARLLGVEPQLESCVDCGSPEVGFFSLPSGGSVCSACRQEDERLEPGVLASWLYLRRHPLEKTRRFRLDTRSSAALQRALQRHLAYHWPASRRAINACRRMMNLECERC